MNGSARLGTAAGAIAIAVYVVGALVMPREPSFDAPAAEVAAFFDENRTRIQVGCAIQALWAPLLVWFLATVSSLARTAGERAATAARVAFGCGLIFVTLFLADVCSLAIAALRPESMLANPELAVSLRDFSWLAMGMAAPAASALVAALAVIALRDRALWPRWVGWLGAATAAVYALRIGTLFTTTGAFAADGILGLWLPVGAIAAFVAVASVTLVRATPPGARA